MTGRRGDREVETAPARETAGHGRGEMSSFGFEEEGLEVVALRVEGGTRSTSRAE